MYRDFMGNVWLDYDGFRSPKTFCADKIKKPKKVIINSKKKTVVLLWYDGSKTIVKTSPGDKFNATFGFLLAYFQKHSCMTKNKANRYLENIVKEQN